MRVFQGTYFVEKLTLLLKQRVLSYLQDVSQTGDGFGPTRPWEPIGSSIDLSTGTFEAAVQILGSDGNAAIALNGGSVLNEDRWFINVGRKESLQQNSQMLNCQQ